MSRAPVEDDKTLLTLVLELIGETYGHHIEA